MSYSWILRGVEWVYRHAIWTVVIFLLLSFGALFSVYKNLGVQTDLAHMISDRLDFHERWLQYRKEFPDLAENFILVVESAFPGEAENLATELSKALREESQFFKSVRRLNGGPSFETVALLHASNRGFLRSIQDLHLSDLTMRFLREPSVASFFVASEAILDRTDAVDFLAQIDNVLAHNQHQISYSFLNPMEEGVNRQYIEVVPHLNYEALLASEPAMLRLREIRQSWREDRGRYFSITGTSALAYEEMQSVSRGAVVAGVLSLILVSLVLCWGLRSFPLISIGIFNLLVGLSLTAGFASIAIGHLNMISVAFAVLFIGLGIDYSIHLGLRFREALSQGLGKLDSIRDSFHDLGPSLVLCSLTTAAAFFAFVPTAYAGVAELGLISGVGMLINFLVHWLLFPAMAKLLPTGPTAALSRSVGGYISDLAYRHYGKVRLGITVLAIACFPFALKTDFDPNPLRLQNSDTEAYQTYRNLMQSAEESPWSIKILKPSAEAAWQTQIFLRELPEVGRVVSVFDFVPDLEANTWSALSRFKSIPLEDLQPVQTDKDRRQFFQFLEEAERKSSRSNPWALQSLAAQASVEKEEWRAKSSGEIFRWGREAFVEPSLNFLKDFQSRIPEAVPRVEDLPPEIRDRWISPNGFYRVEVFAKHDLMDISEMRTFSEAVLRAEPDATDDPVTLPQTGDAVVEAFFQAAMIAFVLVFLILWVMTRRFKDSLIVFIPLVLAALILKALMALLGISFNFANVIVLPLLIGIGVDSGIHLIERFRLKEFSKEKNILGSSSRAVFFSAITTIVSFGTLMTSPHPGTASMGLVLSIGTLSVMLCTLACIPAILRTSKKGEANNA